TAGGAVTAAGERSRWADDAQTKLGTLSHERRIRYADAIVHGHGSVLADAAARIRCAARRGSDRLRAIAVGSHRGHRRSGAAPGMATGHLAGKVGGAPAVA